MTGEYRILIVDDEQTIRDLLAEHLKEEGYSCQTAASGEEALEVFRRDPRHIVVTDIRMGGMSGVELLEEIKKLDGEALVVVITSHASLDTAVATLRAGAYDYIFKPFEDLDQVTEVIRRAMDKVRLVQENRQLVKDLEQSNLMMELANETLMELAVRDGLTGLFNFRHFKHILNEEVARAARYDRRLCLLMLDVDNFKIYNDTHGHPAGDEVLKTIADILTKRLRDVDRSARYGGEEFLVLLPETDLERGQLLAEELRVQIETYPFSGRESQPTGMVTVSLGVAQFPDDGSDPSTLIKKADDALYAAKRGGRNRVCSASKPS